MIYLSKKFTLQWKNQLHLGENYTSGEVSEHSVRKLQKALPRCNISLNGMIMWQRVRDDNSLHPSPLGASSRDELFGDTCCETRDQGPQLDNGICIYITVCCLDLCCVWIITNQILQTFIKNEKRLEVVHMQHKIY